MPAGEPDPVEGPPSAFRGFSTNADDTLREIEDAQPEDEAFDPFEAADDDLSLSPPNNYYAPQPAPAPHRRFGAGAAVGVLTLALVAGVGLAFAWGGLTRPPGSPEAAADREGSRADIARAQGINVEVAQVPPTAVTPPGPPLAPEERLAVLPSAPAPAALARVPAVAPPPRFVGEATSAVAAREMTPAPAAASPRDTELADARPRNPIVRPPADCGGSGSPAERLVCNDARVAAADRRMHRAYAAALAAGAPADELGEDQRDWLDVRDDAALRSRRAVMDIYAQRTEELEALADEAPQ